MTGIRSWIGASRAFGSVVMMAQERTGVSSGRHNSHNPAKANGFFVASWTYTGCLALLPGMVCHS